MRILYVIWIKCVPSDCFAFLDVKLYHKIYIYKNPVQTANVKCKSKTRINLYNYITIYTFFLVYLKHSVNIQIKNCTVQI